MRGFTLAELLVVTSILAMLLTSLCGIYIAMLNEWQREQGQGEALIAVSRTFAAMSTELSQAITVESAMRQGQCDAVIYTLPLDKDATNSYYVPKWVSGSLQYRIGPQKAFYLSNATGKFAANGNILWRGLLSGSYPFSYTVTPDPDWDTDPQRGRISPLGSLRFDADNWGHPRRVTVTVTTSYKVMNSTTAISRRLSVCLRNAN